nr:unnamed protein product [Digitaria exilis]
MRGGGPRGRGGGDRGDQRPPFGHGDGEGGGRSSSFVWPPPATTPHQVSCGAPATPQVSFSPAPPAAQVTMRAPPSSASPAPSSSAPSPLARSSSAEKTMAPPAAAAASDAEADVDLAPVCKKGLAHPARPGLGTVGKSLMMCANHFLVVVADDNLFRNDVSINPESKLRATNREVLNELIKFHGRTALSGKLPAYDGRKSLCTAGAVPFESEEFVVTLVEPEKEQKESVENENTITIRIAGRTDRHQLLRGKQRDMPQETIQECNCSLFLLLKQAGGHTTVLERAFVRNGIPYVSEVPTIIFGADVTLPPPGEYSASSIAAVLASMDWPEITKYRGLVSAQPHRQEIIEDLSTVSKNPQKGHNVNGGMMRELLIAFRSTNRRPARVIAYRDGASEDQFSHVLLHEMDAIRKACASLEEGYLPSVTFMVVQKRHHSRLFHEVHGRRDVNHQSGNILPGMVVDHNIFHPSGLISIYAVMLVFR